jgi:hypothetical protein
MGNWCVAEAVCIGVQESGETIEDAVDACAGGGFVGIGGGGGGLESSWCGVAERGGVGEEGGGTGMGLPEKLAEGHYIWN